MEEAVFIVYVPLSFLQLLLNKNLSNSLRPYHNEDTRLRPITEEIAGVKPCNFIWKRL